MIGLKSQASNVARGGFHLLVMRACHTLLLKLADPSSRLSGKLQVIKELIGGCSRYPVAMHEAPPGAQLVCLPQSLCFWLSLSLHTHTITHSHTPTHCLSLVLVVIIKSKELKTKISLTHSLILSHSLKSFKFFN